MATMPSVFSRHSRLWDRDDVLIIRPIDERIRQLCARAAKADAAELDQVLTELKAALREHSLFMRKMAAHALNRRPPRPWRLARMM